MTHCRKVIRTAALAGLLWAGRLSALEAPLQFEAYERELRTFKPQGYSRLALSADRPEGDWKLPPFNAAHPLYSLLAFADGKRLLVLDKQDGNGKSYDRVIFDGDGNGDLTDDRPVDGEQLPSMGWGLPQTAFPPIDTSVRVGSEAVPFRFMLHLSNRGFDATAKPSDSDLSSLRAAIRSHCSYAAVVSLQGRRYCLAFADGDCNGSFADAGRDMLYIAETDRFDYHDGQLLGSELWIGDRLHHVSLDCAGRRLELREIDQGLVPLVLSCPVRRLALQREGGGHTDLYEPGEQVALLPGTYTVQAYQAVKTDAEGDVWRVIARGGQGGSVRLAAGEAGATLRLGEPFVVQASIDDRALQAWRRSAEAVRLAFRFEGAGGARVMDVARFSGKGAGPPMAGRPSRPDPPVYRVYAADGSLAGQGNFEYG